MSTNIYNLFQTSSSNSDTNLNYLSDYASIKNGSYGKLLKAYYSKDKNSGTSAAGTGSSSGKTVLDKILEERKHPTISKEAQTANSNLTAGISSLSSSVSKLQNAKTYTSEDGASASDKVVTAMKSFVENYNNVVSSAKKSTLTNKTSYVANIMNNTSANSSKLSELGVTINANGTLQLNENKLKATDVSKVQELFSKDDIMSYGSRISSRLQFAGSAASVKTSDTTNSTKTDNKTETGATSLKENIETLISDKLYEKIKDKDGNDVFDIDKILSTAKNFVSNYNIMFDKAESSSNSGVIANLSRIREKTAQNTNSLKQFGIDVNGKGRMKINEDIFKKSDMSKVQNFFKDYGSSIATSASLVNFYMTTQAGASSGYTSAGTYNVQGGLRYTDTM